MLGACAAASNAQEADRHWQCFLQLAWAEAHSMAREHPRMCAQAGFVQGVRWGLLEVLHADLLKKEEPKPEDPVRKLLLQAVADERLSEKLAALFGTCHRGTAKEAEDAEVAGCGGLGLLRGGGPAIRA